MPTLVVCAGPNGSGKSTVTARLPMIGYYVNADRIKSHLNCSDLEAAQNAEKLREDLLARREDFTMETVLSRPRNLLLMQRAKESGYYVCCWYILTADPEINIRRVRERAAKGQHDVPEDVVRSRYMRALTQLPALFGTCDELYIFDNSPERNQGEYSMIASWVSGKLELKPNELWPREKLEALVAGNYPSQFLGWKSE